MGTQLCFKGFALRFETMHKGDAAWWASPLVIAYQGAEIHMDRWQKCPNDMRKTKMRFLCAALVSVSFLTAPVMAKPPLRQVAEIDDGILHVAMADEIRKNCSSISARMIKAVRFVNALENKARDLGYTKDEIKAYTRSEADKDRLRAKAKKLFAQAGVDPAKPETYCAVGLKEIEKSSRIGSFLRAR